MAWFANIAKKYLLQNHYSKIKNKIVNLLYYAKAFQKFKFMELKFKNVSDLLLKASYLNSMFHINILP